MLFLLYSFVFDFFFFFLYIQSPGGNKKLGSFCHRCYDTDLHPARWKRHSEVNLLLQLYYCIKEKGTFLWAFCAFSQRTAYHGRHSRKTGLRKKKKGGGGRCLRRQASDSQISSLPWENEWWGNSTRKPILPRSHTTCAVLFFFFLKKGIKTQLKWTKLLLQLSRVHVNYKFDVKSSPSPPPFPPPLSCLPAVALLDWFVTAGNSHLTASSH